VRWRRPGTGYYGKRAAAAETSVTSRISKTRHPRSRLPAAIRPTADPGSPSAGDRTPAVPPALRPRTAATGPAADRTRCRSRSAAAGPAALRARSFLAEPAEVPADPAPPAEGLHRAPAGPPLLELARRGCRHAHLDELADGPGGTQAARPRTARPPRNHKASAAPSPGQPGSAAQPPTCHDTSPDGPYLAALERLAEAVRAERGELPGGCRCKDPRMPVRLGNMLAAERIAKQLAGQQGQAEDHEREHRRNSTPSPTAPASTRTNPSLSFSSGPGGLRRGRARADTRAAARCWSQSAGTKRPLPAHPAWGPGAPRRLVNATTRR
jgi:hypothetical protein